MLMIQESVAGLWTHFKWVVWASLKPHHSIIAIEYGPVYGPLGPLGEILAYLYMNMHTDAMHTALRQRLATV